MHPSLRPWFLNVAVTLTLCAPGIAAPPGASSPQSEAQPVFAIDRLDQALIAREMTAADDYMTGHGVTQNLHLAAVSYEKAANAGNASAQNQIGYLYQTGTGVPQNMQRAVHWYQLASANGSLGGKVNLAVAYLWGLGVRADPKLAESLFKEASKEGSGTAASYLGDLYLSGIGVAADPEKAIACYERGVKLHSYYAEYKLGLFLSEPNSDPRNLQRAVTLLRKSVSQGYVPAMHVLGLIAVNHPESKVSHEEALSLLKDASDAGSWKASVVLAVLSRDGKWVAKDQVETYRYYKRAVLQGGPPVAAYVHYDLQRLIGSLDPAIVKKLDDEAADWETMHPVPLQLIFKKGQKLVPFNAYALTQPGPGEHVGVLVPPVSE